MSLLLRHSLAILGVFALLDGNPARADGTTSTVYPTGTAATDLANVQAAVASGGRVLLKSVNASGVPQSFEFGRYGYVTAPVDVAIAGETVAGNTTTVSHGWLAFRDAGVPVRIAIHGIHFQKPEGAALYMNWASGVEFTDNTVTDVGPIPYGGMYKGQAVWLAELLAPYYSPSLITGTVIIARNVVKRVYADLSYGIAIANIHAAARIVGNTFEDTRDTAILAVGSQQPLWIQDNRISAGDGAFPGFTFSAGNGIVVGLGCGPALIRGNTINSSNPYADGIALEGIIDSADCEVPGASTIESNTVSMHASQFGAISLYGQISPSLIRRNRLSGDAAFAFDVSYFYGDESTGNEVYLRNDLQGFQSSVADLFFDSLAHDTTYVGAASSAVDFGANNLVTSSLRGLGPQGLTNVLEALRNRASLLVKLHALFPGLEDARDADQSLGSDPAGSVSPLALSISGAQLALRRQAREAHIRAAVHAVQEPADLPPP